jgi:DNA-binding MarR family transcriptional regulator
LAQILTNQIHRLLIIHEIDRIRRRITRYANDLLAPHGVTVNQAQLLLAVLEMEGASAGELGAAVDFDSASLAGLLNRLEGHGLIARERSAEDGRAIRVRATPEGRRLKPAIRTALEDFEERLRRSIAAPDREALERAARAVLSELP